MGTSFPYQGAGSQKSEDGGHNGGNQSPACVLHAAGIFAMFYFFNLSLTFAEFIFHSLEDKLLCPLNEYTYMRSSDR